MTNCRCSDGSSATRTELFVGGGMAGTFLKAQGYEIGASLLEEDLIDFCSDTMKRAAAASTPITLPEDVVVAERIEPDVPTSARGHRRSIPANAMILDIGPRTAAAYAQRLAAMGFRCLERADGRVRGAAVPRGDAPRCGGAGVEQRRSRSSAAARPQSQSRTWGSPSRCRTSRQEAAPSLEFLEGKELPGVAALDDV